MQPEALIRFSIWAIQTISLLKAGVLDHSFTIMELLWNKESFYSIVTSHISLLSCQTKTIVQRTVERGRNKEVNQENFYRPKIGSRWSREMSVLGIKYLYWPFSISHIDYSQTSFSQTQWPRGSELDLWSSACTGAEVRFPLPTLILLQSPWVRDLLYIT